MFFFQDEEIEMIYFLWILYFAGRSLTMTNRQRSACWRSGGNRSTNVQLTTNADRSANVQI